MNPHQTVHIQTLQNSDQPAVSIHFAAQLNRFVVNPKTNCIFVEDYPTAVSAATELMSSTSKELDALHLYVPSQLVTLERKQLIPTPDGWLKDEHHKGIAFRAELPTTVPNGMLLPFSAETQTQLEQKVAIINCILAMVADVKLLVDDTIDLQPLLTATVASFAHRMPDTRANDHYRYDDWYADRRTDRIIAPITSMTTLLMLWCAVALEIPTVLHNQCGTIRFTASSYDEQVEHAKQVAKLYRQIATHMQQHRGSYPLQLVKGKATYFTPSVAPTT